MRNYICRERGGKTRYNNTRVFRPVWKVGWRTFSLRCGCGQTPPPLPTSMTGLGRSSLACLLIFSPSPLSCAERRRKSPLSPSFLLPPPPQPFFLFPNHRTVCRCSSSPFSSFLCPVARGKNEWPPSLLPSQFSSSLTLFSHERSSSSSLPSSPPHPPKTLPFSQKQLFLSSPSSSFSAMK